MSTVSQKTLVRRLRRIRRAHLDAAERSMAKALEALALYAAYTSEPAPSIVGSTVSLARAMAALREARQR